MANINHYLAQAQVPPGPGGTEKYQLLEPQAIGKQPGENAASFTEYASLIYSTVLVIVGAFAILMLVIGGIEYMTKESLSLKLAGKEKVKGALIGLLLALASYLILNTINPNLLTFCLHIGGTCSPI